MTLKDLKQLLVVLAPCAVVLALIYGYYEVKQEACAAKGMLFLQVGFTGGCVYGEKP